MARVRADDAAIAGLLALGISQKDIAKLCGITTQRVAQRKQRVEQYLLTTEERLQGGAKIVDKVIADFVSDAGTVRAADALRLVEMQQARIDPVRRDAETETGNPAHVSFHLHKYSTQHAPEQIIDVTTKVSD